MFKGSWNSWLIDSNKMERLWLLAKIDRVDHLELFCRVHRRDHPDPAGQKIPLRIQQHEQDGDIRVVSHSMDIIRKYCGRTAFMKHGSLVYYGDTQKAVEMYVEDNH